MYKLKQLLALLLVAVVISLGPVGCNKNGEEHPKGDEPATEHPAEEAEPEETKTEEHPAAEHPAAD